MVKEKLVVMTGGTSGIGFLAAKRIIEDHQVHLILAKNRSTPTINAEMIDGDFSALHGVRTFAQRVINRLNETNSQIDILILNAGRVFQNFRTTDGFEANFAINHLAHYYLLKLLISKLRQNATIIVTTSGTHDPKENAMVPAPDHADAYLLAYPETDPSFSKEPKRASGRAYSSSKLCNLLTARAILTLPEIKSQGIRVIAFSPGPTPGTNLVTNQSPIVGFIWRFFGFLIAAVSPKMTKKKEAGKILADLALGKIKVPEGRIYALIKNRKLSFPDPSDLALNDSVMEKLWNDSEKLIRESGMVL